MNARHRIRATHGTQIRISMLPPAVAPDGNRTFNRDQRETFDYWITSSARSSTDCGIVMPISRAVFRFTNNSTLLSDSTGRF